jgi:5-methylcytosine-specific restriction endonuclease McrA
MKYAKTFAIDGIVPNFKKIAEKLNKEEYEKRKKEVLERDGYRCKLCRSMNNLTVDHIVKRSRGRDDSMANLRTLCTDCHDKVDNCPNSPKNEE